MKLPAIQFYPADWRKDPAVQALTFEERGIWLELLFIMHESDCRGKLMLNGKKIPEERLASMLGIDKQKITTAISTFLELGVASLCPETGALMNRRMVRDNAIIEKRREAGKKGGNPNFKRGKPNPYKQKHNQDDKQMDNQNDNQADNQKITPSSSSSSSSSDIIYRAKFKKPTLDEIKLNCAKIGIPESEGIRFFNYYESNGWKVGKNPMKSWQSAMINWRSNWQERNRTGKPSQPGNSTSFWDQL